MESDVSVYNFTRKCLNCARFAAKKMLQITFSYRNSPYPVI